MSKWFKEFKEFALKGNMVDLAIGIIIGAAFGKVVNSLVTDIIMPPIGLLIEGVDFSSLALKIQLPGSTKPPVEIKYGEFINQLINLVIVSGAIFFVVKIMNRLRREPEPNQKPCPKCLMEIPIKAIKCGHCCSEI